MKFNKLYLLVITLFTLTSCFEDRDDNGIFASEINDFVWKGMNAVYLYKDEIPDLANDRFNSDQEYADYLNSYTTPEDLFEGLIYQREIVDRFSFIYDDYIELNQLLSGTSLTNGLRFYSFAPPSNSTERILVIRQVLTGSVADVANLERGQYVIKIDDTTITSDNINDLLGATTYTLHFADYDDNGTPEYSDDIFTPNGNTQTLTKVAFTSNPVQLTDIIDVEGEKLGYILYNAFNADFNTQLNNAFADFQSNNIDHLVIDLRYNGGGSVNTARLLGSMVTGQFNGQIFSKLIYNSTLQSNNTNFEFVNSFNGSTINNLNLSKVYVLTTASTASASELIINSLRPYITVVQIGEVTVGKTQASITIYDSPDLTPTNINPNHTYVMQPLIANSINVNDTAVPGTGLIPDVTLNESVVNLGILGDVNEPLLAAAINDILGNPGRFNYQIPSVPMSKDIKYHPLEKEMYIQPNEINFEQVLNHY